MTNNNEEIVDMDLEQEPVTETVPTPPVSADIIEDEDVIEDVDDDDDDDFIDDDDDEEDDEDDTEDSTSEDPNKSSNMR